MTTNTSNSALFGYARVSTMEQHTERQTDALTAAGVDPDHIYIDRISGATMSRPELDRLLEHLRPGDTVSVLSLDRLGRSTRGVLELISTLEERGVSLRILQLNIDTSTPVGAMLVTLLAAVANLELDILRERTREGLAAARARGRVGGRPAALTETQRAEAVRMHEAGRTTSEIAELLGGCSPRTIRRVLAASR